MHLSRQLVINPFHGYPEENRKILDPNLRETIREFSAIDGAFVIRDDGVVMAAGRHLNAALEDGELPRGLGGRHVAGAGITAVTDAVAIAISESDGAVRIFKQGAILMEIEKASRSAAIYAKEQDSLSEQAGSGRSGEPLSHHSRFASSYLRAELDASAYGLVV